MKIDRKTFLQFLAGLACSTTFRHRRRSISPPWSICYPLPKRWRWGLKVGGSPPPDADHGHRAATRAGALVQEWLAAARIPLLTSDEPT